MNKRNKIVAIAALLTVAGVWLALFGLPGSSLDYAAFAHNYDYNGDTTNDFHAEIDKIADGDTFCEPVQDASIEAVGFPHQLAVCVTDAPAPIGAFSVSILYNRDENGDVIDPPLDTCTDIANAGTALDDNPDANAGTNTWPNSLGDTLGGSWDCSNFGLAYPECEFGGTDGLAKIACLSLTGPWDLGDDPAEDGALAVLNLFAALPGTDNVSLQDVVIGDFTGAEIGSCNPDISFPIPCEGATDIKAFPPDIEVTKTCDDQVLVGDPITCEVHVENIGAGNAVSVGFQDIEVPNPGLSINYTGYAPITAGCAFVGGLGGSLTCALGLMAPGATFDFTIDALAAGPEGFNVNGAGAAVLLGLPDADPTNNSDSAVIHEFEPDINANKLDVTGGLPGVPADGWTMTLLDGACPGGAVLDFGDTVGGTVAFDDLAVGTYCVAETMEAGYARVSCADGVTPEADLDEDVTVDGTAKDVDVDFCNRLINVSMEKDPDLANLWLCEGPTCPPGAGSLVIDEVVSNVSGDPDGVGAFEVQIKFDHKIFDIEADATDWLEAGGTRDVFCTPTIITENWIMLGCVSKDPTPGDGNVPPGVKDSGVAATLTVTPEEDLVHRLTPGQRNGFVRTILDENCELADIWGDPLKDASGALLPGIEPGGLIAVCGDTTLTVRILEGDLDLDCEVTVADDQEIAERYGAQGGFGQPATLLYGPWWDLEPPGGDGDIDIKDLQKVYGRNGSTCEDPFPDQEPELPPP